jgi:hypothetical protein
MTIQGEAGSRGALMQMFEDFKTMQDNQNASKRAMNITIPSSNLNYQVWLENFQMGWDPTTVSYPYVIMLEVNQDLTNITNNAARLAAINNIAKNVGFSPNFTGLSSSLQNLQYNDILSAIKSGDITPKTGG